MASITRARQEKYILFIFFVTYFLTAVVHTTIAQEPTQESSQETPQEPPPETNSQGQTYEEWQAENRRIEEENKRIDEENRKTDEINRQNREDYNKRLEEYNKNKKASEEWAQRVINSRNNTPPAVKTPVYRPLPAPTPKADPNITLFVGKSGETENEESSKAATLSLEKINKSLEDKKIIIKKDSENLLTVSRTDSTAVVPFPVIVNIETKQIQVITPNGTKDLSILPDQVVENLKKDSSLSELSSPMRLEEFNKEPVYIVKAVKSFKIFRLIPIKRPFEVRVSAVTGTITDTSNDGITSFLQKLSF